MRSKKAKALRRIARAFVTQTGKPISDIDKEYKKMKKFYKNTKSK